jgi:hypothetical protein
MTASYGTISRDHQKSSIKSEYYSISDHRPQSVIMEDENEDRSSTHSFEVDPNTRNYDASSSSNSSLADEDFEKSSLSNLSSNSFNKKLILRGPD